MRTKACGKPGHGIFYPWKCDNDIYDAFLLQIEGDWGFPLHYQECYEIVAPENATGDIFIGGANHPAIQGNLYCIGPQCAHSFRLRAAGKGRLAVYTMNAGFFERIVVKLGAATEGLADRFGLAPVVRGKAAQAALAHLCRLSKMRNAVKPHPAEADPTVLGLQDMASLFGALTIIAGQDSGTQEFDPPVHQAVKTIIDTIHARAGESISLDDIARQCNMSKYNLCHTFRRYSGSTVLEFLTDVRMERAKRMMLNEGKNVSEACDACGFANVSHFIKLFARHTGTTPKRWIMERLGKPSS